jgi:hypothetical protein
MLSVCVSSTNNFSASWYDGFNNSKMANVEASDLNVKLELVNVNFYIMIDLQRVNIY